MSEHSTPTVLLIDNDEGILAAMATRLYHQGYDCITAQTGAQGLDSFDPEIVDIVVTDLNMPVLDGMGVIKQVRAISDVPIIVITGFRKDYSQSLRRADSIFLCEKPFSVQNLMDLIETEIFIGRASRAA